MTSRSKPPVASRRLVERRLHGHLLQDPYAWLRRREDGDVLAHLEAENAYTEAMMASTGEAREELFRELRGRIPENDDSVPVRRGSYLYGERLVEGAQYPVFWRRRVAAESTETAKTAEIVEAEGDEQVVLDLEAMAGDGYLSLGVWRVSPDERFAAYAVDRDGSELYELRVRDLESGEDLPDRITGTARGCEWSADGRFLFYVTRDAAYRPYRVYRHRLGEDPESDVLVFEEADERFFLSLEKTRSERYLVLTLATHTTAEIHVLDAGRPLEEPRLVAARQDGIEWQLEHWHGDEREGDEGGFFFLHTNLEAPHGRVLRTPAAAAGERREVVAERRDVVVSGVDCFRGHLVLSIRRDGLSGLEVWRLGAEGELLESHVVHFDEPVHSVAAVDNEVFDTATLRFAFQSPLVPRSIYDYHLETRGRRLRKRTEVHGYEASLYACDRLSVESTGGASVPVSILYRHDREPAGPLLVYAYGSYGTPLEPRFSSVRLSLLDRGFAVALVHARGGGEHGRPWYEAAKLEDKPRTFDDVIAAAEHLVREGWTTPRGLALRGGSAGGLMVGAVLNRRPDLFHAAIAEVPFVDVLNTMLDPSIPLTVIEFEEWGDPASSTDAFEWIRAYSPYENVCRGDYPHLLVTAGLNDPRVQYWEPAKWVARLRQRKTDENLLLFKVEMGSGHVGASGRYNSLRQEAFKLTFLLHSLGLERRDGEAASGVEIAPKGQRRAGARR